jgi:hypothetical protein
MMNARVEPREVGTTISPPSTGMTGESSGHTILLCWALFGWNDHIDSFV